MKNSLGSKSLFIGSFLAAFALLPGLATGATRNVPGDYPTIQAGIDAAVNGDEVIIASDTYSGSGNIDLDFQGKAITVRSAGNSPQTVIIDVALAAGSRGIYFNSGESNASVLQGVTIINGNAADFGGGIRIDNASSPTIRNCIITNNVAVQGGGVNVAGDGSAPIFIDAEITGNQATANLNGTGGGGMRIVADQIGGAVVTVLNSRIDSNVSTAGSGGGILVDRATLKISGSTISNNVAGGWNGGGIAVAGDPSNGAFANAFIANCKLFGNSAAQKGGALRFNHIDPANTLEVVNVLIYDNASNDNGAAIDAWQASPTLTNVTITANTELADNAIIHAHTFGAPASGQPADIALGNSIIFDNITGGALTESADASSSVTISYSDVDDAINFPAGSFGNINDDPLFRDTTVDDFRLQSTSPAIDAADNNVLPPDTLDLDSDTNVTEATPLDLEGSPRRFDDPMVADSGNGSAPVVDMGAYEAIFAPGSVQFSVANYSVTEGAGTATLTVTRTGGSVGAISVDYATSDGTAVAGSDYTAQSGTLNWADGESASKTFAVAITDDTADESNETVNLSLNNPAGGAVLGANNNAVLTLVDDDTTTSGGGSGSGGCFITSGRD